MKISKNNLIEIEIKDGSSYASAIVTEDGRIRHFTGWNDKTKAATIEEVKKHFKGKCGRVLFHAKKDEVALFEASGFKVYEEDLYDIGAMFMEHVYEKSEKSK